MDAANIIKTVLNHYAAVLRVLVRISVIQVSKTYL